MEDFVEMNDQKVTVNGGDLLKKFKSLEYQYNFLREMSKLFYNFLDLYLPKEVGFDSHYFVQVLTGAKKVIIFLINIQLMPIGHHADYDLKYFRKDHILTKDFLINIIQNDQKYRDYIPDNIALKSLTRDYLLSVSFILIFQLIAYLSPNKYTQLYELYKTKLQEKETKYWNNYKVEILPEIKLKMDNFVPCQK